MFCGFAFDSFYKVRSLHTDVILKPYLILFNDWEGVELAKWLHLASL